MRRLAVATLVVLVVLAATIPSVLANWPTTCIGANDAFESAAGRAENVGLYQRVFPDATEAEAACPRDHRADIQTAFAWAVEAPTPAPTPQPTPALTPAVDHTTHPDYQRVRQAALARTGRTDVAVSIAVDVIGRGTVVAFLRGVDDGVQYGRWDCAYRNDACPLAPEGPPQPPQPPEPSGPRIDSGLQHAWNLIASVPLGARLMDMAEARTVTVRWGAIDPTGAYARYRPSMHTIWINGELRDARDVVVATFLAHELWHASSPIPRPRTFNQCVADEVWAVATESGVWGRHFDGIPTRGLSGPWKGPTRSCSAISRSTVQRAGHGRMWRSHGPIRSIMCCTTWATRSPARPERSNEGKRVRGSAIKEFRSRVSLEAGRVS